MQGPFLGLPMTHFEYFAVVLWCWSSYEDRVIVDISHGLSIVALACFDEVSVVKEVQDQGKRGALTCKCDSSSVSY